LSQVAGRAQLGAANISSRFNFGLACGRKARLVPGRNLRPPMPCSSLLPPIARPLNIVQLPPIARPPDLPRAPDQEIEIDRITGWMVLGMGEMKKAGHSAPCSVAQHSSLCRLPILPAVSVLRSCQSCYPVFPFEPWRFIPARDSLAATGEMPTTALAQNGAEDNFSSSGLLGDEIASNL